MGSSKSTLIAIGGGDIAGAKDILDEILRLAMRASDPRVVVMTVATSEPEEAAAKYNRLFRSNGINHVDTVNIALREDAFAKASLKKIERADVLFFTGGDQLNVTSLLGGSPLHDLIRERRETQFVIVGTSAGAAMMSSSMIVSGHSDSPPKVGGVEIAPGLGFFCDSIIDSHFSQRGRHGRLLTAISHYPQSVGIGIDESTAIVSNNSEFKVMGNGSVTVVDSSNMEYSDLPYKKEGELIAMFGVEINVLPRGYTFDLETRVPTAPKQVKFAAQNTKS